jgi:hypothetical protein
MSITRLFSGRTIVALVMASLLAMSFGGMALADDTCLDTGNGDLTAHYINEAPSEPLEVTCDVGIYFDEDGNIDGVEVYGTVEGAKSTQVGIYVSGANVNVTNSVVAVEEDYPHQFVSIRYQGGATGNVRKSEVSGAHRVGILVRGEGTSVNIRSNEITGTGPKTSGWAENGIQVDQGANATIVGNLIADHWWDGDDYVSSGLLVMTDGVTVTRNTLTNNDLGAYLIGDNNNFVHNVVEITHDVINIANTYGVFVLGNNNGVRQSIITSSADAGLGIGVMGTNNKLIRNSVSGWHENIWDGGVDTKWPKPFTE